jgi:hypothetical protein
LIPAAIPAARNPSGAVTPAVRSGTKASRVTVLLL